MGYSWSMDGAENELRLAAADGLAPGVTAHSMGDARCEKVSDIRE
jgi:putative effector of murein hydrolase